MWAMRNPFWFRGRLPLILLAFLLQGSPISSQQISPNLITHYWQAHWITCSGASPHDVSVCYFRKAFAVPSVPEHFVVHLSADNRYQLFVNGTRVARGPARGDLDHWRFESIDLAPQLRSGTNVLTAVVWNFADSAPMAQFSYRAGFVLQGDAGTEFAANTNRSWKALLDSSRGIINSSDEHIEGYYAAGPGERVDGSRYPWGWRSNDYDDSTWKPAAELGTAGPRAIQDTHSRWMLVADTLPPQEETLQRLARVARSQGVTVPPEFSSSHTPITVPPNSDASLLFDQGFETTTYPELEVSGGQDARVRVTYAEALFDSKGLKGNRNEIEGRTIQGLHDEFLPDGGSHRSFEPLWWRAYRYLQVDVHTGAAPLTLEDVRGYFTAYPFRSEATFNSDDPVLQKIWEVGWRTARLCAHETYMDCPYYEQLQYAGDTRIQALISLYVAGDDRLVKNAIELLGDSQTPEGITQSRYPSALPQYIPPFSLYWIGIMHDLWWYRGESEFLRPWLPNMREVLAWYRSRVTPSGLLGRLPWWPFVDWAEAFEAGDPPQEPDGQSSILTLQFAMGLREAADLEAAFGDPEQGKQDRALADKISSAVYSRCWDSGRRLLADTPAKQRYSQQANILGVLADTVPSADQRDLLERVLHDDTLTAASYYFRFYLFRAMKKTGLADRYLAELGPWRDMLNEGLTTFAETPGNTRSDCHAWSAHPSFDLLATVAGIESAAPGFSKVLIAPHLGELSRLSASLPHSRGMITVSYERTGDHLAADVELPAGLTGSFTWSGKNMPLHAGRQHLEL
jgi:alpha-L-rhamnosidase